MSKLVKYFGVNVKKGDYIFREGDAADFMYMIHKGKVQISKGFGGYDEKIRILGEGEFIGEMAVINSLPRSASAMAVDDCVLIKMDQESFNETVQKNHEFSVSVIQLLSERLRETDEMLMVYVKQDRVQKLLLEVMTDMVAKGRRDGSGQWCLLRKDTLVIRISQFMKWDASRVLSVIAELVAMDRLTVKKDSHGDEWIAVRTGQESPSR
jgi:CRP/FNR family transcriptional regulator, cyclic AMP receptor protein